MVSRVAGQKAQRLVHDYLVIGDKKKRRNTFGLSRTRVRGDPVKISNIRTLTRAACYDSFPSLLFCEARHKIVGTPNLEAEDFLEVFSLQPYLVA